MLLPSSVTGTCTHAVDLVDVAADTDIELASLTLEAAVADVELELKSVDTMVGNDDDDDDDGNVDGEDRVLSVVVVVVELPFVVPVEVANTGDVDDVADTLLKGIVVVTDTKLLLLLLRVVVANDVLDSMMLLPLVTVDDMAAVAVAAVVVVPTIDAVEVALDVIVDDASPVGAVDELPAALVSDDVLVEINEGIDDDVALLAVFMVVVVTVLLLLSVVEFIDCFDNDQLSDVDTELISVSVRFSPTHE